VAVFSSAGSIFLWLSLKEAKKNSAPEASNG
jgi:hypothetical protein